MDRPARERASALIAQARPEIHIPVERPTVPLKPSVFDCAARVAVPAGSTASHTTCASDARRRFILSGTTLLMICDSGHGNALGRARHRPVRPALADRARRRREPPRAGRRAVIASILACSRQQMTRRTAVDHGGTGRGRELPSLRDTVSCQQVWALSAQMRSSGATCLRLAEWGRYPPSCRRGRC
jgi:hypothetical protein